MVPYPEPPHATSYQGASHAVFFVPTCLLIFLPSYKPQCYSVWNKTVLPTSLPTFNSLWPRLTYQIGIASFIQIAPGPLQHFSQPRIRKSDSSSCSHFTVAQIGFFPFQIHLAVLKICVNSLLRCPSLLFLTWKNPCSNLNSVPPHFPARSPVNWGFSYFSPATLGPISVPVLCLLSSLATFLVPHIWFLISS